MAAISNNDIAETIYQTSLGKKDGELKDHLKRVVLFLDKKRLLSKKEDILSRLRKIKNKHEGITEATIRTSEKINETTKQDITHLLKKRHDSKEVVIDEIVDDSLLGGFKIEVGDEVIDLTIKNKIKKLQEHLTRYE